MRILVIEARRTSAEYAANQFAQHAVVIARTHDDAMGKLRAFEGGPFDAMLAWQYVATGPADNPSESPSAEISPIVAFAAVVGVTMVGILVKPEDLDPDGRPRSFGWPVTDGRFAVGETRGAMLVCNRPPYAPKPWSQLLALLTGPAP